MITYTKARKASRTRRMDEAMKMDRVGKQVVRGKRDTTMLDSWEATTLRTRRMGEAMKMHRVGKQVVQAKRDTTMLDSWEALTKRVGRSLGFLFLLLSCAGLSCPVAVLGLSFAVLPCLVFVL
jgi:hypothetical protein